MKGDALGLGLEVEDKFSCKPSTTTKLIINYDEIAQTNKSVGLSSIYMLYIYIMLEYSRNMMTMY